MSKPGLRMMWPMDNHWRLRGQERYLQGATLRWAKWRPYREGWDHDHCEFCGVHLSDHPLDDDPETQLDGFVTVDGHQWICGACVDDFKGRFQFVVDGGLV